MKPSISKDTEALLRKWETLPANAPIRFHSDSDPLDRLIYSEGLAVKALHFHLDLNLWLIVLNNGKILKRNLSLSKRLSAASQKQLENYQLLGNGTGIHWPDLDEDISLRGLLQEEITKLSQSLFM